MGDERSGPTQASGGSADQRTPPARGGRRGRATRRVDPSRACLNCGDPTPGEYCPSCGQRKADVQVSIRAMIADVLEDELTVDRRLPATLGPLVARPGQLTVDHVNGRIVRHIRPFRLYLVSSVIFFVLLSFSSLRFIRASMGTLDPTTAGDTLSQDRIDSELDAIGAVLAEPGIPASARAVLVLRQDELRQRRASLADGRPSGDAVPVDTVPVDTVPVDTMPVDTAQADTVPATPGEPDRVRSPTGVEGFMASLATADVNLGHPVLDSAATAKLRQLSRMEPGAAAERLVGDFLRYGSWVMFILLPLFAVMLKLLYIRRRRFYAEHFIFLLHTHAFIYLVFSALLVLVMLGWSRGPMVAGMLAWIAAYVYLAMRRVYGQGRFKTLIKWWTLGWTYFWVLAFAIPIAFLATALLA